MSRMSLEIVASLAEAWIEIILDRIDQISVVVASLAEAWIEIAPSPVPPKEEAVASFAEAWIETHSHGK